MPSFFVNPKKQSFYCYGCGEGGYVLEFIQRHRRLSFKDVLVYLGIEKGNPPKVDHRQLKNRKLIKAFRQWCNDYYNELCTLYRTFNYAKLKATTMPDIEALAKFYHHEPVWEYHMDILLYGDDDIKFQLFKEIADARSNSVV